MKKNAKKTNANITTKSRLINLILLYSVGPIAFYYIMTLIEAAETTRVSGAIFRLMLDIASPLFWGMLMAFVGILDITRLVIILIKEKRQENKIE